MVRNNSRRRTEKSFNEKRIGKMDFGKKVIFFIFHIKMDPQELEIMSKIALSADDHKRVVMDDGVSTLALGHWRLKK